MTGAVADGRPWRDRMLDLAARHGPLPPTKATTTPSGGRHAFYRWPADVPIPAGDELIGFTVRWPGRGYRPSDGRVPARGTRLGGHRRLGVLDGSVYGRYPPACWISASSAPGR